MKNILKVLIILYSVVLCGSLFARSNNSFINDFESALSKDFNEDQLNQMFRKYSSILLPHDDASTLMNNLKGEEVPVHPLSEFAQTDLYKQNMEKLIKSDNPYQRLLSYLIVASANDLSYNDILLERIKNEKLPGCKLWAGMALLYLKDKHTDELFDFVIENDNFGDAHLVPLYLRLDFLLIKGTAFRKISSDNNTARILAATVLGFSEADEKAADVLKDAVRKWPIEIKGYAVNALKTMRAGNLLSVLKPFLNNNYTHEICLEALSDSPTDEDQEFVFQLIPNEGLVSDNMLNILIQSKNKKFATKWLELISKNRVSENHYSRMNDENVLFSEEMRPELLKTIPDIKNAEVLSSIARLLYGKKYYNTEAVLVQLLRHPNDSVRYWAASSLKDCSSKELIKELPVLLKSPEYRTVALTKIIIQNSLSNLQNEYENILAGDVLSLDWERSCIEYLAFFPQIKHKPLFRKYMMDKTEENWSIRRDAAMGLGRLKDRESVVLIINELERQTNDYNKIIFISALGMIKGSEAKAVIEKYRTSSEPLLQKLVEEILLNWDKR
ncbi:MAG: HEAT repeat domain-containing protein [Spirochaetes bacterium]|nr:HEAT repeat domain-containing protein [Spirochaetota bacterium]